MSKFVVYRRADGQWDWRLLARNGQIVATSHGQGFRDERDAVRAVRDVVAVIDNLGGVLNITRENDGE